ncbi:Pentapeptide repeat-containing protein [Paucidesulfovibrio gracilis DSM 16080]|uniref:Pentapeptide repeat-containing protein n=1 Tax=Paucidesulfovibrio gracilis DSM 16080 TaxID=1121449 RepID=A0A1T4XS43_9BACT|nr:pentapeptide repeat-containing protein [Paucidesulfovibrio gracilis]SKA92193.1 Pentapeptide repeat-containing protein [Paucidesulfovibrio gracilis DSM 16080]
MPFSKHDLYEDQTVTQVTCTGPLQDTSFYGCTFQNCSFQSCRLVNCRFEDCTFAQCNLALAVIDGTTFANAEFQDCKLLGINWSPVGGFFTARYKGCAMENNVFADLGLAEFSFTSCSLLNASFFNTRLTRAVFEDCDLAGCRFTDADLSFADFKTARNYHINAETNTLHKTIFSMPEAVSLLSNLDIVLDEEWA